MTDEVTPEVEQTEEKKDSKSFFATNTTSIRVWNKDLEIIRKIQGGLMRKDGKKTNISDAVHHVIEKYQEWKEEKSRPKN